MLAILNHTRTGFFIAMAGLLCLSVMAPVLTVASSDLLAGDVVVVTTATSLRSDVGFTSEVVAEVGAESPASILDGPITDTEATLWYQVEVWDLTGYIPAESLDPSAPSEEPSITDTIEDATDASVLPWKEPIDFGVASSDVICRDASTTSGDEIATISSGQTVEITGEESWVEGVGWTPVNCAGVGGFISSEFIAIEEIEEQVDEIVDEALAETSESDATNDEVVKDAATDADAESSTTTEAADEVEDVDEAQALPWVAPIAFAVASDNVVCRNAPAASANEIVVLTSGQTVEITGAATTVEGISWTPVNCAGVGGFVSTDLLTTEDASDAPVDAEAIIDDVNETVNAEEIIEDVNETANAEAIIEDVNESVEQAITEDVAGASNSQTTTESVVTTGSVETDETQNLAENEISDLVDGVADSLEPVEEDVDQAVEDVTDSVETVEQDVEESVEDVTDSVETVEQDVDQAVEDVTDSIDPNVPTDEERAVIIASVTSVAEMDELATEDLAITVEETSSASLVEDWQILGTAEVQGPNGTGVACRTEADASASVSSVMPEGLGVMVLSEPDANGWMSIVCGSQVGFAQAEFLWLGGAERLLDLNLSSIAVVSGTGGGGLNCRSTASINGNVIGWFPEGSAINARGGALWGWVPVVCGGQDGWVFADYLRASGASVDTGNRSPGNDGGSTNNGGGTSSGTVTVTGTGGSNLNCRTGAGTSNSVITSVRAGSTLTTRGAASGGWQPVTCNGMAGFVSTMYVTAGGGNGTSAPIPAPDVDWDIDLGDNEAPSSSGFANGDRARVNSNLNLRYQPNTGSGIATYAPAGTVVEITGSHAGNGYYPVDWDGLQGYMHGDYLTKTDQAASERGGSARPDLGDALTGGSGGSTATGNAIVDFAMGYVGYPYVWATAGPYSFDCSGFTNWVIKNVVGPDIGRGLWTQVSAGTPVSRNELQPGDLVFHQNTYQPGLSHGGIYIGDNQMVNALNANAGVVVTDITSDYWESRWYGAVRIN